MNRQQLCVRYGWRFSSDMPDVYIKRSGIDEGMIKNAIHNESMANLRKDNEELKTTVATLVGEKREIDQEMYDIVRKEVAEQIKRKFAIASIN